MLKIMGGGIRHVQPNEIYATATPPATSTHFPFAHGMLLKETERLIEDMNYEILESAHALGKEDLTYFGMYRLKTHVAETESWDPLVGIRNSHDKTMAAGLTCGEHVTVCSNLMFSGAFTFTRKHTRHGFTETLDGMAETFTKLPAIDKYISERIDTFKTIPVEDDRDVSKFILECAGRNLIAPNTTVGVWKEWLDPTHDDFKERTLWSLVNSFTTVHGDKNYSPFHIARDTLKLNEFITETWAEELVELDSPLLKSEDREDYTG